MLHIQIAIQIAEIKYGKDYQVCFVPVGDVGNLEPGLQGDSEERLVDFISLESDDPAVKAFTAIGCLAVDASNGGIDVPLERILREVFLAGLNWKKKREEQEDKEVQGLSETLSVGELDDLYGAAILHTFFTGEELERNMRKCNFSEKVRKLTFSQLKKLIKIIQHR